MFLWPAFAWLSAQSFQEIIQVSLHTLQPTGLVGGKFLKPFLLELKNPNVVAILFAHYRTPSEPGNHQERHCDQKEEGDDDRLFHTEKLGSPCGMSQVLSNFMLGINGAYLSFLGELLEEESSFTGSSLGGR